MDKKIWKEFDKAMEQSTKLIKETTKDIPDAETKKAIESMKKTKTPKGYYKEKESFSVEYF